MSGKFKAPENSRTFVLTIAISEDSESALMVEEAGTPNRTVATVPKGEFGVREALRVCGNEVREFYRKKQRELVLTERAAAVKAKREKRITERADKALVERQAPKVPPLEEQTIELPGPGTLRGVEPPAPEPSFTGDFGPNGDATTPGFFDASLPDLVREVEPDRELTTPDPDPARSPGSIAAAALRRKGFGDFTGGKQ